jgi:hypothetical protein
MQMTTLEQSPPGRSAAGAIAAPHRGKATATAPLTPALELRHRVAAHKPLQGFGLLGRKRVLVVARCAIATTPDRVLALGKVASRVADRDRG